MSHGEKLDALGQLVVKYGDDERRRTVTASDRIIKESVEHHLILAFTTTGDQTTTLNLGGIATSIYARWIYFESDQTAKIIFNTNAGGVTTDGYGWSVNPNGWVLGNQTEASGVVRIANRSTQSTANITVAIYLVSST